MKIDWKSLKKFLDDTGLSKIINYIELDTSYYSWIFYEGETFSVTLNKGTSDCEDFVSNYKPQAVLKDDLTLDGVRLQRTMYVGKLKMMHCLFSMFTTSTLITNDVSGLFTIKLRDAQGNITTTENAVKTEIDFSPGVVSGYYGLYGGGVEFIDKIDNDFIINAILAPDIPPEYGGHVYFIRNLVLDCTKQTFSRYAVGVGEIPSEIPGVNVLRLSVSHPVGIQKKFQFEVQYYL